MRLSYFFEDLAKAYRAELEDLHSDSEGKNVLAARLKDKRSQFSLLMPMIDTAPEMVAVAFHGGVTFINPQAMVMLSGSEPDDFPSWEDLAHSIHFEPATQKLADIVLQERGGESFLITTVCLEYLHAKGNGAADNSHDDAHAEFEHDGDDSDEHEEKDLEEAGADWLAEQGFDRRG